MARMGCGSRDPEFWSGDRRTVRSLAEAEQVVWPIAEPQMDGVFFVVFFVITPRRKTYETKTTI